MASMRFVSSPLDPKAPPKVITFDSSPGYSIMRALGDLEESSYTPKLLPPIKGYDAAYEVHMRRASTELNPGPHPLRKVGVLYYTKPSW